MLGCEMWIHASFQFKCAMSPINHNYTCTVTGTLDPPVAPRFDYAMPTLSARTKLIEELMGLAYDPFTSSVSESDPAPDFEHIFVDPEDTLLDLIEREEHTIVFGGYGAGKTATRLALAYRLRKQPALGGKPMLVVTYTPRISNFEPLLPNAVLKQHLDDMVEQAATDAVIQFVERLGERPYGVSEQELAALDVLIRQADSALRARMCATRAEPDNDGAFWRSNLKNQQHVRPIARPVFVSQQWRIVFKRLRQALEDGESVTISWEMIGELVGTLGFRGMMILVDGVDEGRTEPEDMAHAISPLLAQAPSWAKRHRWLKVFVPGNLDQESDQAALVPPEGLTRLFTTVRIPRIGDSELFQIIHQRLIAASAGSSSCRSLDELGDPEAAETIESRIVWLADGSPRVLLRLVDALLRFYANRHAEAIYQQRRPLLSDAEWELFMQQVSREGLGVP